MREKIDFELEIFVTTDTAPTQEPAEKVFSGSAGFTVKNSIVTTFDPMVIFEKNISGSNLKSAHMGVKASPRIDQTLTIDANAEGSMDKTFGVIQPRKFFKVYMAGSVPIVVSGVMRIKGKVNGELHATEKLTIGFDDVSFGVKYANGQFVPYQTVKPVYKLRMGGNGSAEANLEIHLLPSLELTGYEVLTGKAVLDPYVNAGAGVEGHVQMDIDAVDLITEQTGAPTASDADYRLTKTRLGVGVDAYLYADFHIWDTTIKTWPETAKKDDYETFKKVELIADTTIMDLPVLKAFLPEGSGTIHPQDSCAIKIRGTATNIPNPLHAIFPFMDDSYIKWVRWTSPRIVQQLGIPSSSYSFIADPNGEEGVFWARMTKPGTYTVRVGGYSDWGTWARQYTEITVDATDANNNGIPDWWEKRYGLTGTGAEIANGDANGDGRTNLQEWQQCKNPVQKATPSSITATLNANPKSLTVMETVKLWISNAVQAIKSILWDFGDGTTKSNDVVTNGSTAPFDKTYSTSGNKTVTATYLDASGKPLGAASATITVASAPVVPASAPVALITAASADSGSKVGAISNGGSTDDTTPTLNGTVTNLDANTQSVNIYDGNTRLDPAATVTGTTWTFPITTPLELRSHTFTARVEKRLDGTPISAASPAYTITVTGTPPTCAVFQTLNTTTNACELKTCPAGQVLKADGQCQSNTSPTSLPGGFVEAGSIVVTALVADSGTKPGSLLGTMTTDDTTPVISGAFSNDYDNPGVTKVTVYDLGATVNTPLTPTATITGTTWTFTPSVPLSAGVHSLYAVVTTVKDGKNLAKASQVWTLTITTPTSSRYAKVGSYDITECVKDTQTGLIWEGKTPSGWRAGSNTYTNYDSNYGTAAQIAAANNSITYVNAVNTSGLCGFNNGWRMPTKDELLTLLKTGVGSPTIDTTWFQNTPVSGSASVVWSGSPNAYNTGYAWYVNLYNGYSYYSVRSNNYGVRLVRGGQ